MVRRDECRVRNDGRERDLDQWIVAGHGDRADHQVADQHSDQQPADEDHEELQHALADGGGCERPAGHDRQDDAEHYDRSSVVEEALALDEDREPPGGAHLPEQRNDRDRIGCGDQRAEEERRAQREFREGRKHEGYDRRGDEQPWRRQGEDRRQVLDQQPAVQRERRLEDQGRQEDEEDELGRERDPSDGLERLSALHQNAEEDPDQDQAHGVGEVRTPERHGCYHRHQQQRDDPDDSCDDPVVHHRCACYAWMRERSRAPAMAMRTIPGATRPPAICRCRAAPVGGLKSQTGKKCMRRLQESRVFERTSGVGMRSAGPRADRRGPMQSTADSARGDVPGLRGLYASSEAVAVEVYNGVARRPCRQ